MQTPTPTPSTKSSPKNSPSEKSPGDKSLWLVAMPGFFVLLWSTGFIGAKLGLPYAEPFSFLFIRFVITASLLMLAAVVFGARWPRDWSEVGHLCVVGLLIHGGYLGGVFTAIHMGLPAGIAALIVGLQPILTAVGAGLFLGEHVNARQWLGLVLGLVGVVLVLGEKVSLVGQDFSGVIWAGTALVAITVGTLYQKRHGSTADLRSGSAIHFLAAAVPMGILAVLFDTQDIQWTGEFIFALGWLVVVLSLGAVTLLFLMIRQGAASKVASLFYLVPPVTAIIAWALFGETLGVQAIGGMIVAVIGVSLVTRPATP